MSRLHHWPLILGVAAFGGMFCASAEAQSPFRGFHRRMAPPATNPPPSTNPMNPTKLQPNNHLQQPRLMMLLFRQQALTQMALQQAAYSGGGMANSYPSMMGGYSMGGYSMGGYSSSYPNANVPPQVAANASAPNADTGGNGLLAGMVDNQGHIAWPLGLQILRPAPEAKALRERIDGLLRVAAQQAAQGRAPAAATNELHDAIGKLRDALARQRDDMPERTRQDAAAFLRRLELILPAAQAGY